jgi:hypothetical protein
VVRPAIREQAASLVDREAPVGPLAVRIMTTCPDTDVAKI